MESVPTNVTRMRVGVGGQRPSVRAESGCEDLAEIVAEAVGDGGAFRVGEYWPHASIREIGQPQIAVRPGRLRDGSSHPVVATPFVRGRRSRFGVRAPTDADTPV